MKAIALLFYYGILAVAAYHASISPGQNVWVLYMVLVGWALFPVGIALRR